MHHCPNAQPCQRVDLRATANVVLVLVSLAVILAIVVVVVVVVVELSSITGRVWLLSRANELI